MNTSQPAEEPPVQRVDRWLALASITLIVLAVISFFAIIIGTAVGLTHEDFQHGVWPAAAAIMTYGLPVGVVLFFILLITNMVRRSRATKRTTDRKR
ncbi:hypothetical protein [Microbacterium gorillae]|uniref:hypothetical protein n=1 Tax=Microbacterium gorillae TaxID=1231063 RepID=UPI00058B5B51|nr:hypothetical protein [Microbacterium gorillae]